MNNVILSRPLTAPKQASLPPHFEQIENESDLSQKYARRFPHVGRRSEWPARLRLSFELLKARKSADAIVSGRYGEYFALLQSMLPFGRKPHLLLDIEWLQGRGMRFRNFLSRWIRRRIILGVSGIQVFCHAEARQYARYFGVDEAKFIWIPYCVDVPGAPERVEAKEYLLTSGLHQRDYPTLFAAVSGLPVELLVVAPKAFFTSLVVPSNVRLLGFMPSADYHRMLASCRFVVLSLQPHLLRYPGVITYVTAMRMGKCVVVNDRVGASSYIDHGKTGFLVPPLNPQALRDCICGLMADRDAVRKVENNAKRVAENRFAAKNYFSAVERTLTNVLKNS